MAKFDLYTKHLLKAEGGFVNHPNDPGGATNLGITLNVWERHGVDLDGDGDIDIDDLILLTPADALQVYKRRYWNPIKGDGIRSQDIANIVFDMAVNSGVGQATKTLQRQLNKQGFSLSVDGGFGNLTLAAVNKANTPQLFNDFWEARKAFYHALVAQNPKFKSFINGWMNRLNTFVKKKRRLQPVEL